MKLRKGYTYLAQSSYGWSIIQQVSMKQWVETLFTHVGDYEIITPSMQCNGLLMSKQPWKEIHEYNSTVKMRKDMFNILKYGTITNKEEEL